MALREGRSPGGTSPNVAGLFGHACAPDRNPSSQSQHQIATDDTSSLPNKGLLKACKGLLLLVELSFETLDSDRRILIVPRPFIAL